MTATAAIFPGQGSQVVGMGRDVAEHSDHALRVFHAANEVLGFDLASLCFEGPAERLEATDIQQPAIFVTSVALWSALTEDGRRPLPCAALAGLSLGEYTALHLAGALSFADALRLVHRRGQYMQEASEASAGGMVSLLGVEEAEVDALCHRAGGAGVLGPANFNCPGQIVVSGEAQACRRLLELVEQEGCGKAVPLKVAGAFHSGLMRPAADALLPWLQQAPLSAPRTTVLSNVDAQPHTDPGRMVDLLYRQIFHPVRWQACIQRLIADGVERFVEIGPGRVLTGLMRKIDRRRTAINVSTVASLTEFATHS